LELPLDHENSFACRCSAQLNRWRKSFPDQSPHCRLSRRFCLSICFFL